jgi:hypothetical protein
MTPRRWCRNRIKKRRLSERSEFPTLPDFGASGVGTPRSGAASPESPFLAYVFWRSKRGRSAAGPRPGLVVRQAQRRCFTRQGKPAAKPLLTLATVAQRKAPLPRPPDGQGAADLTAVGSSREFGPAADPLFAPPKSGAKRRPLRRRSVLRTDCTRRQGLKREASETRCAQTADASLSVSVPGDASPSNGDPRQRQRQKQRQRQRQRQRQLSLRGTSKTTATVAARARATVSASNKQYRLQAGSGKSAQNWIRRCRPSPSAGAP